MERMQRPKGDLLGTLAAGWIGSLGGLFAGALGTGTTLIAPSYTYPALLSGYYASGTVYGFIGGGIIGALVGLGTAGALAGRLRSRDAAVAGGAIGVAAAWGYGRFADFLAVALEGAFRGNAALGGLLGAIAFAAAGGMLAVALRSGSADTGRRAAFLDLIAGGLVGSFVGLLGGGLTESLTIAWGTLTSYGASGAAGSNVGLFFGFYLGAVVGAVVAVLAGIGVRRLGASRANRAIPSK